MFVTVFRDQYSFLELSTGTIDFDLLTWVMNFAIQNPSPLHHWETIHVRNLENVK